MTIQIGDIVKCAKESIVGKVVAIHHHEGEGIIPNDNKKGLVEYTVTGANQLVNDSGLVLTTVLDKFEFEIDEIVLFSNDFNFNPANKTMTTGVVTSIYLGKPTKYKVAGSNLILPETSICKTKP